MEIAKNYDSVIIGAGISGLSLGYYLKQLGKKVLILESSNRVGGVIESGWKDGFLLEYGPQTCMGEPEIFTLCEALGITEKIIYPACVAKKRFIAASNFKDSGKIFSVPQSLKEFITSDMLSIKNKIKLLSELFKNHSTQAEKNVTLENIFNRRFGEELTSNVVSAMLLGVWGTTPDKLEAKSANPLVYDAYSKGNSIIKTLAGKLQERKLYKNHSGIISFRGGLQVLVHALASEIGSENILLSVKDITLAPKKKDEKKEITFNISSTKNSLKADSIIFSIPSYESLKFFRPDESSEPGNHLSSISYTPMGVLHALISKKHLPEFAKEGFGVLLPPGSTETLLGVIFSSTLFEEHISDSTRNKEKALFTCFFSKESSNLKKEEPGTTPLRELKTLFGLSELPECIVTRYREHAIPVYAPGHFERAQYLKNISTNKAEYKNIYFLSNVLEGVSIPSRIKTSMMLAAELALGK